MEENLFMNKNIIRIFYSYDSVPKALRRPYFVFFEVIVIYRTFTYL